MIHEGDVILVEKEISHSTDGGFTTTLYKGWYIIYFIDDKHTECMAKWTPQHENDHLDPKRRSQGFYIRGDDVFYSTAMHKLKVMTKEEYAIYTLHQ